MRVLGWMIFVVVLLIVAESTVAAQSGGTIQFGETVTGDLQSAAGDRWMFAGQVGDVVYIRLDSSDFDPTLELIAPDGSSLDTDDDGGTGFNAEIRVMLPADGEYTIIALSFRGGSGAYTLSLWQIDPEHDMTIAYGETREGWFDDNEDNDLWLFAGSTGDIVVLRVYPGGSLDLYDPQGEKILTAPREISLRLPSNGNYMIQVHSYESAERTRYTLGLRQVTPRTSFTIHLGEMVESIVDANGERWTFSGEAGEGVRIFVRGDYRSMDISLMDSSGNILAERTNYPEIVYRLPTTGDYSIRITSPRYVVYRLFLERAQVVPIVYGEILTSSVLSLYGGGFYTDMLWTFDGQANDLVMIDMQTNLEDIDQELRVGIMPFVTLYDSRGYRLTMGTYRTFYRLPATGNYTMLVGAGTLGPFPHLNYRISLNRILPRTNDRIAYGDTITTILTDPNGELWTFDGGYEDIISVVMWSRDAPPILELRGTTGQLLREGMMLDPRYWDRETLIHILPSETTYHTYMLYTTLDLPPESPAGEYILSLHALDPERIEIGQMVSRELTDPTGDFTTFYGVTGDEVCVRWNERIHARAANFVLYAPDYSVYDLVTPIAQSSDCYRLPTTGWYLTALYAIDPMPLAQPEPYSFLLYYRSVP